jgi:hypothetical protein
MAANVSQPSYLGNTSTNRQSIDLLPGIFKTDKNAKFLAGTIDQFIQPAQVERINGWVGSKNTPTFKPSTDNYIDSTSHLRTSYQVEPSLVIKNVNLETKQALAYDDLISKLYFEGSNVSNLDKLLTPEFYSYNPHIDWDKIVNFEKYYWMPYGPAVVDVTGEIKATVSTYTVSDSDNGNYFLFTPDGLTPAPQLTLFRGVTYVFNIQTTNKFWFKTQRVDGTESPYRGVDVNGINNGQIIFKVDENTPDSLFYVDETTDFNGGEIIIQSITDNSNIDIVRDVIGKRYFTSGNGVELTNGMRIAFSGNVTPVEYQDKEFYVEGVGTEIRLINVASLEVPEKFISTLDDDFDATPFDDYPFDTFINAPITPEYVTINRASLDRNPWSRYNRWFHEDVIIASAVYNGVNPVLPVENRAKRPIVEFEPDFQLYNFGSIAAPNVQHIDTLTTDVFDSIEGQLGYYVDGVEIANGDRIIFTADTDNYVNSRIWKVTFAKIEGILRIALVEADDSPPATGTGVIITSGTNSKGTCWWFNGTSWTSSQQKIVLNQAPRFDVFDSNEHSLGDATYYQSNFAGSKVFGYGIGSGVADSILGFPLKYKNLANQAFYLFENYFMKEEYSAVDGDVTTSISPRNNFLKKNKSYESYRYLNVWEEAQTYTIPVLQSIVPIDRVDTLEVTGIDYPAYQNIKLDVFLNNNKLFENTDYTISAEKGKLFVLLTTPIGTTDHVLFKIFSNATPNTNGYYEVSPGWSNNPMNGYIQEFTLSELTDHVKSMADRHPDFVGNYAGKNNIRDLKNLSSYGTRLIRNKNPLAFAGYFVTDEAHNVIDAIRSVERHYNQFKLNFLSQATALKGEYNAAQSVDIIMANINLARNLKSQYYYSDMIAYGTDVVTNTITVTDPRNVEYGLNSIFTPSVNNSRAVFVYHTPVNTGIQTQLLYGRDYTFEQYESTVLIKKPLVKGDKITVSDYTSTDGCFIPPTPTKLGLYPKFVPEIFTDSSYAGTPKKMIKGHDGSTTLAFDDYRDDIILELERRIYNNIKINYNPELLNLHSIMPGRFRNSKFGRSVTTTMLRSEFLRWNNFYGFDYEVNDTFSDDPKTWNFITANDPDTLIPLLGNHRGIYSYYFDTTTPHQTPWEMLGFSEMPEWWIDTYGPAPYSQGNEIMWQDLENGFVRDPANPGVNPIFARPGLSKIIPVDVNGNLLDPASAGIAQNLDANNLNLNWEFGDQSPVETAWRKSSHYPYSVQILAALISPASYASLLFDTSRVVKNLAGQYVYSENTDFLSPANLVICGDESNGSLIRATGYSVFLTETGKFKSKTYVSDLKSDLTNMSMKLLTKVGGFVSQDKLEIIIDSVNPSSTNPGVALSNEDYEIFLDQSNPIESIGVSGIIIQRTAEGYVVRGYDNSRPYFTCFTPSQGSVITVGGKNEAFVKWTASSPTGNGLTANELSTAVSANDGYIFYKAGQIVLYEGRYYRAKVGHTSGSSFNLSYFQSLPSLPRYGGISVYRPSKFDSIEVIVPYGKTITSVQEVYDLIVGYGAWLTSKGLMFDEFNADFGEVMNWQFTGKEFLYWASQGWSSNSVITVSPFANSFQYKNTSAMVDDLSNEYYEYSVLKADGKPLKEIYLNVMRQDGLVSVSTRNTNDGIYFIKLNCVQKEHSLIFNNTSLFNDVIYDVETGYGQRRLKLTGLRTSQWNGSLHSPGFIYDKAVIEDWEEYTDYHPGDVVRYSGSYYSAIRRLSGTSAFDFTDWQLLDKKPQAELLPNFDYKINQFQDFYSLDIDNFDSNQQALAQHLIGYTPRPYLDNIFVNPISQYKFYQGFIREKGTRNTISKLAKASKETLGSYVDYFEEWAFRVGEFGAYTTDSSLEINLDENKFKENPQLVEFTAAQSFVRPNETRIYKDPTELIFSPQGTEASAPFYTIATSDSDLIQLPYAGYPRLDDVYATAFNKATLIDVANNRALNDGDTIWVGFTENLDWEMYRHTKIDANVSNASIVIQGSTLLVDTDISHGLVENDIINITQFDPQVNGVYQVQQIVSSTQFIIKTLTKSLPESFNPGIGVLFKFISVRFQDGIDQLADFSLLSKMENSAKLWIDNDGTGKWVVLEKQQAYSGSTYSPQTKKSRNQQFTEQVLTTPDGTKIIAGAPNYYNTASGVYGKIYALRKDTTGTNGIIITDEVLLNISAAAKFYGSSTDPRFGTSLAFDNDNNFVIAGAPYASGVKFTATSRAFYDVNFTWSTGTYTNQGLVKWTSVNYDSESIVEHFAIASSEPQTNAYFGHDIYLGNPATDRKILVVSSPGQTVSGQTNAGAVHWSTYAVTGTQITTVTNAQHKLVPIQQALNTDAEFGKSITGDYAGTTIAVGAPGLDDSQGGVYIFDYQSTATRFTNTQLIQAIDLGIVNSDTGFGRNVLMNNAGDTLFISASDIEDTDFKIGKVFVLTRNANTTTFTYSQTLMCPFDYSGYYFGSEMSVTPDGTIVYIASSEQHIVPDITFDTYSTSLGNYINSKSSNENTDATTFDGKSTTFNSKKESGNGSVYTFEKQDTKFYFGQEIRNDSIGNNLGYASSLASSDNTLLVGAPGQSYDTTQTGLLSVFEHSDYTWKKLRQEDNIVDLTKIKTVKTIDTVDQTILDYIELYDPIKGRIPGIADQEIKYKTAFDPAVYSIGVPGVKVDTNTNWIDEHIGELWWDLSSVKYVWYEQGEVEFRKNNWGNLFPGCTIDVYEWVSSTNLPSQWSAIADTNAGLSQGISGQPKFPSNAVVSVKQVFNATTNALTNVYYYWVKNKITIPAVSSRSISSYDVALLIANPKSQGMKYVAVIADNTLALTNMKSDIVGTNINLNVDMDTIDNSINKHTEWLLVQEGNPDSQPNTLLMKKLKDSLVGHDSLGNQVPDPTLNDRRKYGVSIRPRQTLFKDRYGALRTLTEYGNSILKDINFVGYSNIDYFTSNEEYAQPAEGVYDIVVGSVLERDFSVVTRKLKTGVLSLSVRYGRITEVLVTNPGFGYGNLYAVEYNLNNDPTLWVGPTVEVVGDGTGGKITTYVNSVGQIVKATIADPGKNYTVAPTAVVRPFTVLVQADETVNNRWSYYTWTNVYTRKKTQSWNTPEYWSYIDWQHPSYNKSIDIARTVNNPYQLSYVEDLPTGSYVKINNAGDGRFVIIRKTDGTIGTFSDLFDLIYQENGSIQINDKIWNTQFGFDYEIGFDQLKFDQKPDIETENIINGLLSITSNEYAVYGNLLFFKMVKYALAEQKFLDWAFKTSFISVVNNAGALDQRPTYRLNNESYYEQYINETKPFHTKIRNFQANYTATDITQSVITDFDSPSVYNADLQKFVPVQIGSMLNLQYPWKSWYDNYTYHVDKIEVYDGGDGYEYPPEIVFSPAPGDSGTGATAEAYIARGKVTQIVVTNPGTGYAATPVVTLLGGGPSNVTTAKVGIRMSNGLVRSSLIKLKFDRVSGYNEIESAESEDTFRADGFRNTYKLTWTPTAEKAITTVTVDGIKLLDDAYSINVSTEKFNGYTKSYGEIKLKEIPAYTATVIVTYIKDVGLYHAVDRIRDYYKPESGMPGNTATLLMAGLEYPGVTVESLPLVSSTGFDSTPYGSNNWDDFLPEVGLYRTTGSNLTSVFSLNYVPKIGNTLTVYVNNVRIYGTSTFSTSSQHLQLVNGLVQPDGYTNTVDIYQLTTGTTSTTVPTLITGGTGPYPTTTGFVVVENTATLQVVPGWSCLVTGYAEPFIVTSASHNSTFNGRGFLLNGGVAFTLRFPITFYSPGDVNVVDFRLASSDGSLPITDVDLDTYISGGNGFTTIFRDGVADNPSPDYDDIIIDGEKLVSIYNSYGPEENLPGRVSESLGISVYTQPTTGAALTVLRTYIANNSTTVYSIGITPPNADSVEVLRNNNVVSNYTIDYANQTITLGNPQPGRLSIRTMSVGGRNVIDQTKVIATTSTSVIDFAPKLVEVKDWYITKNGVKLVKDTDFTLTAVNLRTRLTLTPPLAVGEVLQVWLFAAPIKAFSEVRSQTITAQPGETSWALTYPPENIQPYHTQVIVEQDGRRLTPPPTTYYVADGVETSYSINTNISWGQGVPSRRSVQVYVNGEPAKFGKDFELIQSENRITFLPNFLQQGDVIAICILLKHQYTVSDGNVYVTGLVNTDTTSTVKVYSFTNHDDSLIRRESFVGENGNAFTLARPVLGSEYLWVDLNGRPLMRNYEFELVNGNQVVIDRNIMLTVNDNIVITSVSNASDTNYVLGYRMFLDNLGRNHYKRLSKAASTQLASTLTSTATSIDLVDATVLTPPNFGKFIPGVIIINGERIQFYKVEGNTISNLVRGSLGTGIRDSYPSGTTVLDQGSYQTLHVEDSQQVWMTNITNTNMLSYNLTGMTVPNSTSTAYDVYYQGCLLRKPGTMATATNKLAYDSNEVTSIGTPSNYDLTGEYDISNGVLTLTTSSVTIGSRLQVISRYGKSMYAQIQPGTKNIPVDPMHQNATAQVEFLSRSPSALPDKYYYGQQ